MRERPAETIPELLTVEALAARWHVRPGTLRLWAREGKLPSFKIGRKILFRAEDLVRFLESRRGVA